MIGKSLFAVNLVQYLKDKDGEEHFAEAEAPDNRAAAVPIGRTRHFISSLMELGVRFRAVAFLDADPFNLHFQAEMAERAR